jgi:prophage antirepressor-like protein
MSQLLAFNFESSNVRIVMDANGEPWFVAADVCSAININTEQSRRLDEDEKGLRIVQTPGGQQEMVTINESGLYSLILTSRKAEAKRFKRWVTHDVLPAIRKTGSYQVPAAAIAVPVHTQDRVSAILAIGEAVAKVPGVKAGVAMAATLACINENTGITVEALRRALPAANDPIGSLNPTQIGEQLGLSPKAVNIRLRDLGFQFKNERGDWELTEPGQQFGEAIPYMRNGHSGYQILWLPAVVEQLREVA